MHKAVRELIEQLGFLEPSAAVVEAAADLRGLPLASAAGLEVLRRAILSLAVVQRDLLAAAIGHG